MNRNSLRKKIVKSLNEQGFEINGGIYPKKNNKNYIRKLHKLKRNEQLKEHKKFLLDNIGLVRKYLVIPENFDPKKIDLEIREVKPNSIDSKLFLWWNLAWWSLPYNRPIGRQMRFIIWDKHHNSVFGLIGLQSPPLASAIRDNFLGLKNGKREKWINQSLYAQRLGALPPYNDLIGGKLVGLSLVSKEIKNAYKKKYWNKSTWMESKKIPPRLLFITTTSAFGKSSVYERIKYKGDSHSLFLGYTSGAGTFHLPEELYKELLILLGKGGVNVKRGYGTGPSRKMKLVDKGFKILGLNGSTKTFIFHNVKRGYYLFPLVNNLSKVITKNARPDWKNFEFKEIAEYWKARWGLPRSKRKNEWKNHNPSKFIKDFEKQLLKIK